MKDCGKCDFIWDNDYCPTCVALKAFTELTEDEKKNCYNTFSLNWKDSYTGFCNQMKNSIWNTNTFDIVVY